MYPIVLSALAVRGNVGGELSTSTSEVFKTETVEQLSSNRAHAST